MMNIFYKLRARYWALEDSDRKRIKIASGVVLCFIVVAVAQALL
jgi:hypothetical protein|tara:strand:- start:207 stop:338 length:132 start_codon:yes stop_codon:yes gene_type:complete